MTTTRTGTDWLATADPSWYLHVLTILQRDFPDAADMAWSTAISENAEAQIERYGSTGRTIGQALANPAHSAIGSTRACPDCGRPQHYTGTEAGWCHDALVATWHCADPRKAGA